LQRIATSAANGSLAALRKVVALVESPDFSRPDLLAPAFFANLDTSGIPTAAQLKTSALPLGSTISRAILSLKALSVRSAAGGKLVLSTDASASVWPRAWKWLQFLDRYREDIAKFNPFNDTKSYAIYCAIISRLQDDQETRDLIYATTGVRDLITRGWVFFLDNQSSPDVDFTSVCRFILEDTVSPINIDGIMMGSGGSITELARLFVAHLTFVIPSPDSPVPADAPLLLRGVIRLLREINYRNELWNAALLAQGIIESLICTIRALAVSSIEGTEQMLDDCFTTLIRTLVVPNRHQYIIDALKAGLLPAIVLSHSFTVGAKFCLTVALPRAMVYYSVLKQLATELHQVKDLAETARFRASETFESWTNFLDLVDTRFKVMRRYDSGDWLSGRNCDNLNVCTLRRMLSNCLLSFISAASS
jgi:hypothetical protein